MLHFEQYDEITAPENSSELLKQAKIKFGAIPNLQAVMASSHELLRGYQILYDLGSKTSFTPIERQVVYLTISYYNDCNYCMAAHSFQAFRKDKIPKEILEELRKGLTLTATKLEVLRKFVIRAIQTNGKLTETDYKLFLSAGYSKKNILEIVLLLAVKVMSNYTNHIAKPELDKVFKSQTWNKKTKDR